MIAQPASWSYLIYNPNLRISLITVMLLSMRHHHTCLLPDIYKIAKIEFQRTLYSSGVTSLQVFKLSEKAFGSIPIAFS